MSIKLIIVGGVAGGASAATRARRIDEKAEIILLERGEYISFANCGLPYYIGGVIKERDSLFVTSPKMLKDRFNIDVRIFSEAISIDRENKKIHIKDLKNKTVYQENYDKLILSTGAAPLKPPIPGIDLDTIFTLRNIPDTDAIKAFINEKKPKKAVVVGGGFIGVEMAENMHHLGLDVTLVEMLDQILPPFDREMASPIHQYARDMGLNLKLGDGVKSCEKEGERTIVTTQGGSRIESDMVILSIGVRPENKLAKEAGLEMGERGGIKTDRYMRTSDIDIFAIGDAAEIKNFITGKPTMIPLAGPAGKQGRIAADNAFGGESVYMGSQGTAVVKVFDMVAASTGLNEKTLKRYNIPYLISYNHSPSHASYYPGSQMMVVKIIFAPNTGKILGAQTVGMEGVDKRTDVLATAIRGGMTVFDLEELELAYAPPFSSARDPVNLAGMIAANIIRGTTKAISWEELDSIDKDKSVLLDVRDKAELRLAGKVEGSKNIPLHELRGRLSELDKNMNYLVYCTSGHRSYFAHRILTQQGVDSRNISGGFKTYKAHSDESRGNKPKEKKVKKTAGKPESLNLEDIKAHFELNACGIQCPGPIMKLKKQVDLMENGQIVEVKASDTAFPKDIRSWCSSTGNELLKFESKKGVHTALIRKGAAIAQLQPVTGSGAPKELTLILFSDDLDRAMAAFIIANGAASIGVKVNMFFTFWGLNVLKKKDGKPVKKDILARMFGAMMPKGPSDLSLSKMHIGGLGTGMMKYVMENKNVESLEVLIQSAIEQDVKLTACTMTMDIMGIKREELMDGIDEGGVASYLENATKANVNLFI